MARPSRVAGRIAPSSEQLRDLRVLIDAYHPLIRIESVEFDRVETLLWYLADQIGVPLLQWTAHGGLRRYGESGVGVAGTIPLPKALAFVDDAQKEAIYHFVGATRALEEPALASRFRSIYERLHRHRGALVISGPPVDALPDVGPLFSPLDLRDPTEEDYYAFVSSVLKDMAETRSVSVDLKGEDVAVLLHHLRGLSFFEVRRVITQAVVEDGRLDKSDLQTILQAKRRIIEASGVLEYFPSDTGLGDIAGLRRMKRWLQTRSAAFNDPDSAAQFGLTPPRGLLLLGVQGCGKSLSAKAIGNEWNLPLVRLDPSKLYNKFVGESERNLRRAIRTAESMAPIVMWVDEIEKAFGGQGNDGGASQRIFGTFLSWLQEKREDVFVIATANDISALPPELLRKGRFDEIFFVDLPSDDVREKIFEVHLKRRGRNPADFDLKRLADACEGFSGAEIEQAIISALFSAFNRQEELLTDTLIEELKLTRPLSVTMGEKVMALRNWARDRAVNADE